MYKALSSRHKGPFTSVSDWYNAIRSWTESLLRCLPKTVADYEILAKLSDNIIVEGFRSGPFVINHNDLTVQNILVRNHCFAKARVTG